LASGDKIPPRHFFERQTLSTKVSAETMQDSDSPQHHPAPPTESAEHERIEGEQPSEKTAPDLSPATSGWREKWTALLARARGALQARRNGSASADPSNEAGGSFSAKIRTKLADLLSQAASGRPSGFDPKALAEWARTRFKKSSIGFYAKALTLLLCAYFLADLTGLLAEKLLPSPPSARISRPPLERPQPKTIEAFEPIMARNLFDSTQKGPGEEGGVNPEDMGPPIKTSLPFNLVGTLILKDELRSIATIEDKSASQVYPVRVQDEIPSKVRIHKIEPGKVTFLNLMSNRYEFVELPEEALKLPKNITLSGQSSRKGVEQVSPTHFNIAKSTVEKTMSDFNKVLTEARAIPNFENGVPAGYKLFQIVPGSIFDALGLKNGDTITAINGQSINDPAKAFEMLNELKSGANSFEITMKRDGKAQTNNYEIR
jgi:general secretion pathway protein C